MPLDQQITISRCAGRGERPYLQFTFGDPLRTHPGIVFKLTANPTDTGSTNTRLALWKVDPASATSGVLRGVWSTSDYHNRKRPPRKRTRVIVFILTV